MDTLVCARVADGPAYVPGTTARCADCRHEVHVSDSSRPIVAQGVEYLCTHCMPERLKAMDEPPEISVLPESILELRAWMNRQ